MNKLLKLIIINFLFGGILVSGFAVITDKFSYGLGGNLLGALPIITTYMIFHAYVNDRAAATSNMLWQAVLGALVYIIFNISFILLYSSFKNVFASYFTALAIWVTCQIILIGCILPQFNIELLRKKAE